MKMMLSAAVFGVSMLIVAPAASAQLQNLCAAESPPVSVGGWILDVTRPPSSNWSGRLIVVYSRTGADQPPVSAGRVTTITDGTSNTLLVAERTPRLFCGDVNGNGRVGLTQADLVLRDVLSFEVKLLSVIPLSGEIDEEGEGQVIMVIGDTTNLGDFQFRWLAGARRE